MKLLLVHSFKENFSRTKKIRTNTTKLNVNRKKHNLNQSNQSKQRNKKQKNCQKKKKNDNVEKQEWTCPLCKETWKENAIDWTVFRTCTVWVHEDCSINEVRF